MGGLREAIHHELRRGLGIEMAEVENLSDAGARGLAAGDRVRFRLVLRNDAETTFARVAGFAVATELTRFAPARFEARDVKPGDEVVLATIEASVLRSPSGFASADSLATVTLTATACLKEVTIREMDRAVPYFAPRKRSRRSRWSGGPAPRSIPLSS